MQRQMILVLGISCVLVSTALGQTASPSAPPVPKVSTNAAGPNPSSVGMDQPVITLKGGCEPREGTTPSADCVKAVTREQFEKLINALQPDMNADAKYGFATNYGRLLVYSDAARSLHLENDPHLQQIMKFLTDQVLADGLKRYYAEQFAHPGEQQVQDYYNQNSAKYLEATLQRVIIPRKQGASDKPTPSAADENAAAEKIRQLWVAGEDPAKLQQAAFEAAGVTGASMPDVNMGAKRPGSLQANHETVFQLKAGEVSHVYSDPSAAYLYKVVSVRKVPLGEVKDSIIKTLQQQQVQAKLEEIGKSASPVLNEEYFGPPPAATAPQAGGRPVPGGAPPPSNPPK
jgi:hypothetical protein